MPIDIAIGDWCQKSSVKCISVLPQIVDSHKAAGSLDRESDVGVYSPQEFRQKVHTYNMVKSVRLDLDATLEEETDEENLEMQLPNDELPVGPRRLGLVGRVT